MWGTMHNRFQDQFQAALIIVLLCLLLLSGGYSVVYIMDSSSDRDKYILLQKDYVLLLNKFQSEIRVERERRLSPVEDRVVVIQKRLNILEQKVDSLEDRVK